MYFKIGFFFKELIISFLNMLYIFIKIAVLVAVIYILSFFANDYIILWKNYFINKNPEIGGVIIGAFLASLFGILSNMFLTRFNNKKNMKKFARLLYNEMNNISLVLSTTRYHIKDLEDQEGTIFNVLDEINFDPNWREHYTYIMDALPYECYNVISSTYGAAQKYNESICKKDLELLKNSIKDYNLIASNWGSIPVIKIHDLLNDLNNIGNNKSVRKNIFLKIIKELYFIKTKNDYFIVIENKVVSLLEKNNNLQINEVIKQVESWVERNFTKLKDKHKFNQRLIFEVVIDSDKIELGWGECKLK